MRLEKKINKQNKGESESKHNNKLWQITLDALDEAVFLIDLDHKILQCNKGTLDILGKTNYNEVIGHSCGELVHGTNEPVDWCPVRRMWKTGHRETDVQLLNGKWFEILAEPIHNDGGEITGAIHIISDIDARKKAEDIQKSAEQQYLTILNSLSDAMHVVDRDFRIIFQNPAMNKWLKLLNLNPNNIGRTIFEAFPFLEHDKVYNEYQNVFTNREYIVTTETTQLFNRVIYTETLKIPIISEGEVSQIITILRDVTDQKEAEKKLKDSEEKYKNIINNLMDIVIILDLKGNFEYVSPQTYDISGFKPEEIIGKNGFKFMHPEDVRNAAEILSEAMDEKKRVYIEYRTIHKEGYYIDVSASGRIVNIDGEDKIFAVVRDMSDQKRAEQKLKESEEKYRLITENANDMIAILNNKIEYEYINEAAYQKIMGRTRDLLIGGNGLRWVHPDDAEKCLNAFKQTWEKGEATIQARFKDINEKYHWLDIRGKTISNEKGEKKVLVVARDISEIKKFEQKLKESEEKYKYLIENSMEGVWVLDSNADTVLVNPSMANILGYSINEMIGKSVFSFMDKKQTEVTKFHLEKRKKGISEERDAVFIHKKGNNVYLRVRATPIFSIDGTYEGSYAFLEDITKRRQTEQKLKESEENFRTIAEQAFIGTLIIQNDKVEYVNNALLQIFEYSHEEIDGWTKSDLIKLIFPEDLHYLREYREKLRAGESDIKQYYSYRVFTKYGKTKWIDQFSRPIIYKGKSAELVTIMDITEKKRAEQELIKLNSLKSELLRRTSHELKTPLVSIKGFSDLLLTVHKDKLDDYVLATIHEIKLGCERLENLIQDILKTSELESESVELKKSEEDLSFLIKLCIKELQGLIKLRNHEIRLDIHDKLITYLEPDQIHLVISNLLNNAIKYTPPNGRIEIKSAIMDDSILISIHDNGIGLTNEEKKRLFSQFGKIERYGQGLDIISDGSGLGLFITKKIVELHSGRIWVRSKGRNKGSTFYFSLPLIVKNKK
ncbi:MAG: PAS domain S-box protein [Promethearchaeota archaeon]